MILFYLLCGFVLGVAVTVALFKAAAIPHEDEGESK